MDYFPRWAEHEFGLAPGIPATLLAGIVFVVLLPELIIEGTLAFNRWLNVPGTGGSVVNHVLGAGVGILGWLLGIWTVNPWPRSHPCAGKTQYRKSHESRPVHRIASRSGPIHGADL